MDFTEYQEKASDTAVYPGQGSLIGLAYAALGLNGEAGETAEQIKKTWRDDSSDLHANVNGAIQELRHGLKSTLAHSVVLERAEARVDESFKLTITPERREKILKELGDTLWYAAQVATELGADLGDVAQQNIDKLAARVASNNIHGEGSDR